MMSVRSKTLSPDKWSEKAPDYIREARKFDIRIYGPNINKSNTEFTIAGKAICFGFSAIKKVGGNSSELIVQSRENEPFKDIVDFLSRIDRAKINTGVFQQLIRAGCFDSMGYLRKDLLESVEGLYEWFDTKKEYEERAIENIKREEENIEIERLIEHRDFLRKKTKKESLSDEELAFLEENKRLMKKRPLKLPEVKEPPDIKRHERIALPLHEIISQGEQLGCYIIHPASIVFRNAKLISEINEVDTYQVAGIVTDVKTYNNSSSQRTYVSLYDSSDSIRIPIYSNTKVPIPKPGDIIQTKIKAGYPDSLGNADSPIRVYKVLELSIYGEN